MLKTKAKAGVAIVSLNKLLFLYLVILNRDLLSMQFHRQGLLYHQITEKHN